MGRLGKQAREKVSESAFQKYLVLPFHSCFASYLSYKHRMPAMTECNDRVDAFWTRILVFE